MILAGVALSLVVAFGAAIAFVPALRLDSRKRTALFIGLCIPIFLAPLVVPGDQVFARFLASVSSLLIWMKTCDLYLDAERAARLGGRPALAFLPNWGSMVWRRLESEPCPSPRDNKLGLAFGVAGLGMSVPALYWLFHRDWSAQPFMLEHSTKAVGIFLTLSPVGWTAMSILRLAGAKAMDFLKAPLLARTPADFWRRYNRPVQFFFFEDVFKRVGGLRSPVRATLITFAISGLLHEYVFGIATGTIRGFQMLYFMIQGCAVAATLRVRPRGWRALLWIAGTCIFNLGSSVLFFANVNDIIPFYSRELPEWLGLW